MSVRDYDMGEQVFDVVVETEVPDEAGPWDVSENVVQVFAGVMMGVVYSQGVYMETLAIYTNGLLVVEENFVA